MRKAVMVMRERLIRKLYLFKKEDEPSSTKSDCFILLSSEYFCFLLLALPMIIPSIYILSAINGLLPKSYSSCSAVIPAKLVPACFKQGAGIHNLLNLQELDSR